MNSIKVFPIILLILLNFDRVKCEEKTIPIAAVIPALQVAGQLLPVIGAVIQAIPSPNPPSKPLSPSLPAVAVSHTTSVSANILNKPLATRYETISIHH